MYETLKYRSIGIYIYIYIHVLRLLIEQKYHSFQLLFCLTSISTHYEFQFDVKLFWEIGKQAWKSIASVEKSCQSILTNIWKIDIQFKSEIYHSSSRYIVSHLSWIARVRDRFVTRFVIATLSIHRFRIRSLVFPTKLETVLLVAFDGFLRLPS